MLNTKRKMHIAGGGLSATVMIIKEKINMLPCNHT